MSILTPPPDAKPAGFPEKRAKPQLVRSAMPQARVLFGADDFRPSALPYLPIKLRADCVSSAAYKSQENVMHSFV
jgi:hypothetical protein